MALQLLFADPPPQQGMEIDSPVVAQAPAPLPNPHKALQGPQCSPPKDCSHGAPPPVNKASKLTPSFEDVARRKPSNPIVAKVGTYKAPTPKLILTAETHIPYIVQVNSTALVAAYNTKAASSPTTPSCLQGATWTIEGRLKLFPLPSSSLEKILLHGLPILHDILHVSFRRNQPSFMHRAVLKAVLLCYSPTQGIPVKDLIRSIKDDNNLDRESFNIPSSRFLISDSNQSRPHTPLS